MTRPLFVWCSALLIAAPLFAAQTQTTITTCGTVTAFAAASQLTTGLIVIAGQPYVITAGTTLQNQALATAGADLCLKATLNLAGQIIVPSSVSLHANVALTICGTVTAFISATSNAAGSITIGGRTFRITPGTTIANSDAIAAGVSICLDATLDINGDIVPPTAVQPNHPPTLTAPGPQTATVGETLRFVVSARDDDAGDSIRITAVGVPPNASFAPHDGNPADGTFTFTPSSDQIGATLRVVFTARDNRGGETSAHVDVVVTNGAGEPPPPPPEETSVCLPVTEIIFNHACGMVKVPVRNDSDGQVTVREVAMAEGSQFHLSGAPTGVLVLPPHSAIEIGVSFDGGNAAASDRIVIRTGASGETTTEVMVRNGDAKRRPVAH